ncbi:MAG: peptide chain release factor N(5)-glutamine methyltransferase [candidate division Zixibacteria bacterium]|nr:peptide chain release factor N(5)-glutamine methyltransferase [candidate division Zixibacteria bacterium]
MGITILEALNSATRTFWEKDIENPRIEAELLIGHILNLKRTELYLKGQIALSSKEENILEQLIKQRLTGRPLQYVLEETEFFGLKFKTDSRALIPRPETEILVSKVLEHFKNRETDSLKIVDIGTGCGNIAISLAFNLKNSLIYATDISPESLNLAGENAKLNKVDDRVKFLPGDLLTPLEDENLKGKIDAIVSNPPYVLKEEKELLPKIVRDYEPEIALFYEKGLYQRIIEQSLVYLKKEDLLALETGYNQAQKVKDIIETKDNFVSTEIIKDLAGIERVVLAIKR